MQTKVVFAVICNLCSAVFRVKRQHAKVLIGKRAAQRAFIHFATTKILLAEATVHGKGNTFAIKRIVGFDINEAGYRLAGHICGYRLVNDKPARDECRETVKSRNAAVFCAGDINAINRNRRVSKGRASQVNVTCLALVTFDGNSWDPRQRIRQILIGEAANGIG